MNFAAQERYFTMIKIHTYLNGEFLILIGPMADSGYTNRFYRLFIKRQRAVVFPDSGSFVITPVSPHNLNIRPIVVPDNNIIFV